MHITSPYPSPHHNLFVFFLFVFLRVPCDHDLHQLIATIFMLTLYLHDSPLSNKARRLITTNRYANNSPPPTFVPRLFLLSFLQGIQSPSKQWSKKKATNVTIPPARACTLDTQQTQASFNREASNRSPALSFPNAHKPPLPTISCSPPLVRKHKPRSCGTQRSPVRVCERAMPREINGLCRTGRVCRLSA